MAEKFNFTEASINRLAVSVENNKSEIFYDLGLKGLTLMLFPTGTKTFYLSKKIQGKACKIKIGRHPDVSVEVARKKALALLGDIADNKNPQREKRILSKESFFQELFHRYLSDHAKNRKKTWKDDKANYERYFASWGNKKLSSIEHSDIRKKHQEIGETRPYMANRLVSLIRKVYNFAIKERIYIGENPAIGIDRFKEESRERFLHPDEFPAFFKSLEQEQNSIIRDYILISLLTGARQANVLAMKWEDINFTRKTWLINGSEMKNNSSQTVPLTDEVIKVLLQRKLLNEAEAEAELRRVQMNRGVLSKVEDFRRWVFPGKNSKSGHLESPKRAWANILKRAGIKNLRLHDLRRTLGSYQAMTGASSYIIGKTLNHKSSVATSVYARLNLDPVRSSMITATNAMLNAGKGDKESNGDSSGEKKKND